MSKKLLALFGLKWNPFLPDVPDEALFRPAAVESFAWRLEHLARVGGFAAVTGDLGTGKSVAMRLISDRLKALRDVVVGNLSRPQARLADFYRELGHLFGVPLVPHNRWAGAKDLRDKWLAHVEGSLFRPVLLVDEAQEMRPEVFSELRLLTSADLDARSLVTVVLAGDRRLQEKLSHPDLRPIDNRIRARLVLDTATPQQLQEYLRHALEQAGSPKLMTASLQTALCEHAAGNVRSLMSMANELLLAGAHREVTQLDEKLFFEVFAPPERKTGAQPTAGKRR